MVARNTKKGKCSFLMIKLPDLIIHFRVDEITFQYIDFLLSPR